VWVGASTFLTGVEITWAGEVVGVGILTDVVWAATVGAGWTGTTVFAGAVWAGAAGVVWDICLTGAEVTWTGATTFAFVVGVATLTGVTGAATGVALATTGAAAAFIG